MSRDRMRWFFSVLLGAVMVIGWGSAAWAGDEIGLSSDGVTWSDSLSTPLLDQARRWVPGDSDRVVFFVRNQGPSSARMVISVKSADTDDLLANDDVTLRARADGGSWADLRNGKPSRELNPEPIARADLSKVEVDVTFNSAADNSSQQSSLGVVLEVTLTDARAGKDGDGNDEDPGGDEQNIDGLLPSTGSTGSAGVLWVGAALLGVGLATVRASRERARRG